MKKLVKKISLIAFTLCTFSACVQKTIKHNIYVEVDMRNEEEVESAGIRGEYPPLSWNEDLPLDDPDSDGIYTGTFVMDIPYDSFQYKFVLNGEEYELKGQENRILRFEGKTELRLKAKYNER